MMESCKILLSFIYYLVDNVIDDCRRILYLTAYLITMLSSPLKLNVKFYYPLRYDELDEQY